MSERDRKAYNRLFVMLDWFSLNSANSPNLTQNRKNTIVAGVHQEWMVVLLPGKADNVSDWMEIPEGGGYREVKIIFTLSIVLLSSDTSRTRSEHIFSTDHNFFLENDEEAFST